MKKDICNQNILKLLYDNGFQKDTLGTLFYSIVIEEAVRRLAVCSNDKEKIKLKRDLLIVDSDFYKSVALSLSFDFEIFIYLIVTASKNIMLGQNNFVDEVCKKNRYKKFDYRVFVYELAEKILSEENNKILDKNNNLSKLVKIRK